MRFTGVSPGDFLAWTRRLIEANQDSPSPSLSTRHVQGQGGSEYALLGNLEGRPRLGEVVEVEVEPQDAGQQVQAHLRVGSGQLPLVESNAVLHESHNDFAIVVRQRMLCVRAKQGGEGGNIFDADNYTI